MKMREEQGINKRREEKSGSSGCCARFASKIILEYINEEARGARNIIRGSPGVLKKNHGSGSA